MNLIKIFFIKKVKLKELELLEIKIQIENNIINIHHAKQSKFDVPEDYLFSDLTKLWKKRKQHEVFIQKYGNL